MCACFRMWLQPRPLDSGTVMLAAAGCRHLPELWTSLIDESRLAIVAYQAGMLKLQAARAARQQQ
jgi:hypothetical protein